MLKAVQLGSQMANVTSIVRWRPELPALEDLIEHWIGTRILHYDRILRVKSDLFE
jgi:hypothetical protein